MAPGDDGTHNSLVMIDMFTKKNSKLGWTSKHCVGKESEIHIESNAKRKKMKKKSGKKL